MRYLLVILLYLFSSNSFATTAEKCEKHVKKNINTFSICSNSGVTDYNGTSVLNFEIRNCSQKTIDSNWICKVGQAPQPSSSCEMKITLDKDCYYNISTEVTYEGREDIL